MRTAFDVGEIIRCHGDAFFRNHKVVPAVRKAFSHLAACRTSALGGHVEVCPECGEVHVSYNSCRDRHCPKCQNRKREEWIDFRKEEILPVRYFHVVFTVPACLNPVAMGHQREFYNALFQAAWSTLRSFAAAEGLTPGMTSVLHTWGANLFYHPHIHCIVPGGGIDTYGRWHGFKGCGRKDFLFPVRAMGKVFRARFLSLLTRRLKGEGFSISQKIRKQCFSEEWVVYARPPAKGAGQVLEYIGRYAYRVAISNSRILNVGNGMVTYDYKDYRKGGRHASMTVTADTFLTLFSMHILPDHFVKVRHYGILAASGREHLRSIQRQLEVKPVPKVRRRKPFLQICAEKGWGIGVCRHCNCKRIIVDILPPVPRAPPFGVGSGHFGK